MLKYLSTLHPTHKHYIPMDLLKLYIYLWMPVPFNSVATSPLHVSKGGPGLMSMLGTVSVGYGHCRGNTFAHKVPIFSKYVWKTWAPATVSIFTSCPLRKIKAFSMMTENRSYKFKEMHNAYLTACSRRWCRFHLRENTKTNHYSVECLLSSFVRFILCLPFNRLFPHFFSSLSSFTQVQPQLEVLLPLCQEEFRGQTVESESDTPQTCSTLKYAAQCVSCECTWWAQGCASPFSWHGRLHICQLQKIITVQHTHTQTHTFIPRQTVSYIINLVRSLCSWPADFHDCYYYS